jgi:hypothetical protein
MFDQLFEQVDDVLMLMDMDFHYKMKQELIVVVYQEVHVTLVLKLTLFDNVQK